MEQIDWFTIYIVVLMVTVWFIIFIIWMFDKGDSNPLNYLRKLANDMVFITDRY